MYSFIDHVLMGSHTERVRWLSVTVAGCILLIIAAAYILFYVAPAYQKARRSPPLQDSSPSKIEVRAGPTSSTKSSVALGGFLSEVSIDGYLFQVTNNGTINLNLGGLPAPVEQLHVMSPQGGTAEIEVYLLFDRAAWAFDSFANFVDQKGGDVDLSSLLDSDEFASRAKNTDAIVCLGLVSGLSNTSSKITMQLADDRANHLCGLISRKAYLDPVLTKIFGLPLGIHTNRSVKKRSAEERKQRGIILIGIKASSGDLAEEPMRQRMISAILQNNSIKGFQTSAYSEVLGKKPLRYIEVKRGIYASKQAA